MDDVSKNENRYRAGLEVRRSVLGDPHVDRAEDTATDFDRPFQQLITEAAWGTVWARPGLSKRERSIELPDCFIAFACGGFEFFAVDYSHRATKVFDEAGFLQNTSCKAHTGASGAEHLRQKFVGHR